MFKWILKDWIHIIEINVTTYVYDLKLNPILQSINKVDFRSWIASSAFYYSCLRPTECILIIWEEKKNFSVISLTNYQYNTLHKVVKHQLEWQACTYIRDENK